MIELNPNCSEATVRIRTNNLTQQEYKILLKIVEEWENSEDWCDDSWWVEDIIFGVSHIKISGNFPFNFSEEIKDKLDRIPFGDKIDEEWEG